MQSLKWHFLLGILLVEFQLQLVSIYGAETTSNKDDETPVVNTRFYYFLKSDPQTPRSFDEIKDLPNPPKNLLVYTHGWNAKDLRDSESYQFKDEMFNKTPQYDAVMLVDWSPTDTSWFKYRTVQNKWTPVAAQKLTDELQRLNSEAQILPTSLTMVAHSLGTAVMGQAGRNLQKRGVGTVKRMVGLDPSVKVLGPGEAVLRKSDASEVDVIHTSKKLGRRDIIGENDLCFYMFDHPELQKCKWWQTDCAHRAAKPIGIEFIAGTLKHKPACESGSKNIILKRRLEQYRNSGESQPLTIFVLDYSPSMDDSDRLHNLVASTKQQLSTFPLNRKVAMVIFGGYARVVFGVTLVTDEATRKSLANMVPGSGSTIWGTSIGAGLNAAKGLIPADGCASIVLTTDGEENTRPYATDVQMPTCSSISSIAVGPNAAQVLEGLGSHTVSVADNTGVGKLWEGLRKAEEDTLPSWLRTVNYPTKTLDIYNKTVLDYVIDHGTKNLTFTFDPFNDKGLEVIITPPNGKILDTCTHLDIGTSCTASKATPGIWKVKASKKSGGRRRKRDGVQEYITIHANSQPGTEFNTFPVVLQSDVSNSTVDPQNGQLTAIYATLATGVDVILGATLEASITSPDGHTVKIKLYDDGIAADKAKGDGVYSRYILTPLNVGARYEVSVVASCNDKACGVKSDDDDEKEKMKIAQPFERETIAGSIRALSEYKVPPPSAVNDLRVMGYDDTENQRTVKLTWSAVGAAADSDDTASGIELRWAGPNQNVNLTENDFDWDLVNDSQIGEGPLKPVMPRIEQMATVTLSAEAPECIYFNVRYSNEKGEFAQDSNIVSNCDWTEIEPEDGGLGLAGIFMIIIGVIAAIGLTTFVCVKKKVYQLIPTSISTTS